MKDTLRLIFSGDFAPLIHSDNPDIDPFKDVQKLISTADAHITNLECPLTDHLSPIKKTGPSLKGKIENISILKHASVSIACLANNHIFDFGEEGVADTVNVCHRNGIDTIGIVNRGDQKPHWLIKEIKGKKIGLINYCEHEFSVRAEGLPGAYGYDPVTAFYDMAKLKPDCDFLVVIYHGGNEYFPIPGPELKKTFHYLADLGADAVIGHHTHVYSGYEMYKGKPLVYGLGNFYFPLENEPKSWNLGLVCRLKLSDKIGIELHPILQKGKDVKVSFLEGEELLTVKKEINRLSRIIRSKADHIRYWNQYSEKMGPGYIRQFPCLSKPMRLLMKLGLPITMFLPKKKLRNFGNIIKCQSHLELLKDAVERGMKK